MNRLIRWCVVVAALFLSVGFSGLTMRSTLAAPGTTPSGGAGPDTAPSGAAAPNKAQPDKAQPDKAQPDTAQPATSPFDAAHADAAPATEPATKPADVAPAAQKLIDQVGAAYLKLNSLDLAGTIAEDLDAGGRKITSSAPIAAQFQAPNKFHSDAKDEITINSDGKKLSVYLNARNIFQSIDAPADRLDAADLPEPLRILTAQNPSLLLAISKNPAVIPLGGASRIDLQPDTMIDGAAYPTLAIDQPQQRTLWIVHPETHLLRRVVVDFSAGLKDRGVPEVKNAIFTIDYTTTTPDAKVAVEQFAFKTPDHAKEMATQASDDPYHHPEAEKLMGHPVPDFKLTGIDGKTVTKADLKGTVYIVDFWASWCGPCLKSLPHLDALYQSKKADGLKMFAVNINEDKPTVEQFVAKTKLGIPAMIEPSDEVIKGFMVDGIPETVLVGKDGQVLKVWVSARPTPEQELKKAVEAAMK